MARLNRFRLQYSLRSLLLFVLAASAFMAWFEIGGHNTSY